MRSVSKSYFFFWLSQCAGIFFRPRTKMFKIKFPTCLFVVEKNFRHIGWVKKKSKIFSAKLAGDISAKLSLCFCRSSPVSSLWKLAITFFLGTFRKNKFFFPRSDFYSEQFCTWSRSLKVPLQCSLKKKKQKWPLFATCYFTRDIFYIPNKL